MIFIQRSLWTICIVLWLGCSAETSKTPVRVVTFDMATKKPYVTDAVQQYPAAHPETGKPTLMPALYCPKCSDWHMGPPPEELSRSKQPLTCAKCKGLLVINGPMPAQP